MRIDPPAPRPGLALRFALRELRGGLSGFYIFLGCIALGVAAITGVNSVAETITRGIAERGQEILGGDLSVSAIQRELPAEVVELLGDRGTVSKSVNLRAMARLPDGSDQALVELKAVDTAYPLYGNLKTGEVDIDPAGFSTRSAWVEPILLERLSLGKGDEIAVGNASLVIEGVITEEPDRISEGIGFGPRIMVSQEALDRMGLVRPGSLYRTNWNVRLDNAGEANLSSLREELRERFADEGLRIRSREDAAPSLSRNIERFSQFLTLVGLAALIVGGVGVANSVRAFLDMKRDDIAAMKSLGAAGPFIFRLYLFQILILAAIGVAIGLAIGMAAPLAAGVFLAGMLPVPEDGGGFGWMPIFLGSTYGLLTAFIFAVWPLGKARETRAASLFRASGFQGRAMPKPAYLIMLAVSLALLCVLAVFFSDNREIAIIFIIAIAFCFLILRVTAMIIMWLAARIPPLPRPELRMAVANLHRPGAHTPSVVLSLGLGLALIAALAIIDASLRTQITSNIPRNAPDFFFVDIQDSEMEGFRSAVGSVASEGSLEAVPMLRGRITRLKDIPAQDYETEQGQWVLRGDRGITYARDLPENSTISRGEWWPPDYAGEPLVSFTAEEAGELGLDVGDMIEVNVLGRRIEARISNLRNVEWETLAINFVMIFSPNTLAGAPHAWLATLTMPDGGTASSRITARDGEILRRITSEFPTVTSVRVRDAIDTVNSLIGQLSIAVRAASAFALVASFLVLAGALAAGNRGRTHDAVVLKTLGARRSFLIRAMVIEYALLGTVTAIFALLAGGAAAWYVVTRIMTFQLALQPLIVTTVVALALAATIGLGLAATWRVLGQKPAAVLREL